MTAHRSLSRTAAAVAATATAALILTACGGNSDRSDAHSGHADNSAKGKHNAADMSFATGMIAHHRQAVKMAGLAASRASSPKVKQLSAAIEKAQGPEIKTMSGWLKSWGKQASSKTPGMRHSGHAMPGMMKPRDMEALKSASGKKFDSTFLGMMIEHHKGAVSMANTEKSRGSYLPAKDLAKDIARSQTAEIEKMHRLLGR